MKRRWPIPKGWDQRDPMFDLVPDDCRVVVEIGSLAGFWAARCLAALPEAHLWCVDPWARDWGPDHVKQRRRPEIKADEMYQEWLLNTAPWVERVHSIRLPSDDAAPYFDRPIDFLLIDGDHRGWQSLNDLKNWYPKLRPGALLVGHDIKIRGVKRSVRKFFPGGGVVIDHRSELPSIRDDQYYVSALHVVRPPGCFWRYKPGV